MEREERKELKARAEEAYSGMEYFRDAIAAQVHEVIEQNRAEIEDFKGRLAVIGSMSTPAGQ